MTIYAPDAFVLSFPPTLVTTGEDTTNLVVASIIFLLFRSMISLEYSLSVI